MSDNVNFRDLNYLINLPEHVFLKVTKYLSVQDLLNLEESFEKCDDKKSDLFDLSFKNLQIFKLYHVDYWYYDDAIKNLLRCGSELNYFKIYAQHDYVISSIVKNCQDFMVRLANQCPNLFKFDRSFLAIERRL